MAFQILVLMGEELGVDCTEIIIVLREILKQYPELWGSIEEPVEEILAVAS